jgi:CheY-like chemotaxis protein
MRLRCVIVDDSPAVLRAASELLEGEGIAVVGVAATGEEAVRVMEELTPDVMLVDIDLGPESGFELARRLVHTRNGDRSRTILISTPAPRSASCPNRICPGRRFAGSWPELTTKEGIEPRGT